MSSWARVGAVYDSTIFRLRNRYPTMLEFYKASDEWIYEPDAFAFLPKQGAENFFEVVYGPWPRESMFKSLLKPTEVPA